MEAVIKVERKPAERLKHIRRYSMPGMEMRQEEVLIILSVFTLRKQSKRTRWIDSRILINEIRLTVHSDGHAEYSADFEGVLFA